MPLFIKVSFLTLGKCWETDGTSLLDAFVAGASSVYAILTLFRVRRGEKYGEVMVVS